MALEAVILGIIQGLTEFLPISSSGHLSLIPDLFQLEGELWRDGDSKLVFVVAAHVGTALSVLVYYWKDWWSLTRNFTRAAVRADVRDDDFKMFIYILIGCIPAGVLGLIYKATDVSDFFHTVAVNPAAFWIIIGMFLGVSVLMVLADIYLPRRAREEKIGLKHALSIGFAQSIALIPGTSRSGITIITGMAIRMPRATAARFSFFLATPLIFALGIYETVTFFTQYDATLIAKYWSVLLIGLVVSAVVGYAAIHFLIRYLQRNTLTIFVIYRVAFVILAIILYYTVVR